MRIDDFREMYRAELQELRSVEAQLVEALPRMARAAEHPELRQAFERHAEETRSQMDRLTEVLVRHKVDPREHVDQGMQAMIHEADKTAQIVQDRALRDAALIASAQRIEHYEIAVYGTLATWAKGLGLTEDQRTLHDILEEEKLTDERLTDLAKEIINPDALNA